MKWRRVVVGALVVAVLLLAAVALWLREGGGARDHEAAMRVAESEPAALAPTVTLTDEPAATPTQPPPPRAADSASTGTLAQVVAPESVILRGRIVTQDTRAAIDGMRLSTRPFTALLPLPAGYSPDVALAEAVTDATGAFQLRVKGGPRDWVLFHDRLDLIESCTTSGGYIVVKADSLAAPEPPTFRMVGAVHLQVTVVEPDGSPLAGDATIRMVDDYAGQWGPFPLPLGGRIDLAICKGRRTHLIAERGNQRGDVLLRDMWQDHPVEVTITLQESCSVAGKVVNAAGEPLPDIIVHASTLVDGRMYPHSANAETRSDASGRWRLDKVIPGEVRVYARPPTGDPSLAPPPPEIMALEPGEHRDDVNFVMLAAKSLEGTLWDVEGNPIPGATIQTTSYTQMQLRCESDATGRFKLLQIEPHLDSLNLNVWATGFAPSSYVGHPLDGKPLDVVLKRGGTITVEVKNRITGEIYGAAVSYSWQDGGRGVALSSEGRATIANIPPGLYFLRSEVLDVKSGATLSGLKTVEHTTDDIEVTIELGAPPILRGIVVSGRDEAPVAGANVHVGWFRSVGGSNQPLPTNSTVTGADGRFELEARSLANYPTDLWAEKGKLGMGAPIRIEPTPADPPEDFVLGLHPPGVITGRIRGLDGEALRGARLQFYSQPTQQDLPPDAFAIGADGTLRIEGLALGKYVLLLRQDELRIVVTRDVNLIEQPEAEVEFDTSRLVTVTGALRVNGGMPLPEDTLDLSPSGTNDEKLSFVVPNEPDGHYIIRMSPGDLTLRRRADGGHGVVLAQHQIGETPRVRRIDMNVELCDVGVAVVHAGLGTRVTGEVFLRGRHRIDGDGPLSTESRLTERKAWVVKGGAYFPGMPPGRYQARFKSPDGALVGMSSIVTVEPGDDVTIELPVEHFTRHTPPGDRLFD